MNSVFYTSLLREGSLAAQMLAMGVTNLRKGDTARPGLFLASLFELSIGLERAGKIIVVVDFAIENKGQFPRDAFLRNLHHHLGRLYEAVTTIAEKRINKTTRYPLPADPIHSKMIGILSDFAKATRYRNLDAIVQGKSASMQSPEAAWFKNLGADILARHYSERMKSSDILLAKRTTRAWEGIGGVMELGHDGQWITNMQDAITRNLCTDAILKHSQFYMLQIIRFFAQTLSDVQNAAHRNGLQDVPYLSELFSYFYNDDAYFRSRRTWTR